MGLIAVTLALVGQLLVAAPVFVDTAHAREVSRLSGSDRITTAVAVSQARWPSATDAVLATGANFPDALAAGGLAAKVGGPLLLTWSDRLPDVVLVELQRLAVQRVWVIGGSSAVSPAVEELLRGHGYDVRRLAGPDRFATAAAVAEEVAEEGAQEVLVALGGHAEAARAWPDALSAGAFAALRTVPPLLLTPGNALPGATWDALGYDGVLDGPDATARIIGGTAAVSDAVAGELAGLVPNVARHAGRNRFATSLDVATAVLDRMDATPRPLIVASGANFPDGLTAAGLAARVGGILILVPPGDLAQVPEIGTWVATHGDRFSALMVVGGSSAVSPTVEQQLEEALGPVEGRAVELTLTAPAAVTANDVFTYEVVVRNDGPETARLVAVSLEMPTAGAFIASNPMALPLDGHVELQLGTIPSGGEAVATVRWAAPPNRATLIARAAVLSPHTAEEAEAVTEVFLPSTSQSGELEGHSDTAFVEDPEFLEDVLTTDWCYATAVAGPTPSLAQARSNLRSWLVDQVGAIELAEFQSSPDVRDDDLVGAAATSAILANSPAAAMAVLLAAHDREPHNPNPLVSLAPLATNFGFAAEALALLDAAAATGIQPAGVSGVDGAAVAANNRGHALLAMGQWSAAEPHLRQAIALTPELMEAKRNLSKSLLCTGRKSAAIAAFVDGSRRNEPDTLVEIEESGSRPSIPEVYDLSQGKAYTMPAVPYVDTADHAAAMAPTYLSMLNDTYMGRIDARNQERFKLWSQQDPKMSVATRARLADVTSTIATVSDEPALVDLWKAVDEAVQKIDDDSAAFWGDLTADDQGRFKSWGCDEERRSATASAARGRYAQWRPLMADLDTAMRAYAKAAYPYMTAVAASVRSSGDHRLAMIDIETDVDIWYYTMLVTRAHFEAQYQSYWWPCFEPPPHDPTPPEDPAAPPEAARCSEQAKQINAELDAEVVKLAVNCERVALEVTAGIKRLPGLAHFASADYAYSTGVLSLFGGMSIGGLGVGGKAGIYATVQTGPNPSILDAGLRFQGSIDIGKGVKISSWDDTIDIPFSYLAAGVAEYHPFR